MTEKQPELFAKPLRKPVRKLMHVIDAGAEAAHFKCSHCGFASWYQLEKGDTVSKLKRGIPCPNCNQKGQPIQAHPDYHDGFFDAMDLEPLFDDAKTEYSAGWKAYWEIHAMLRQPDFLETVKARLLPVDGTGLYREARET